MEGGHVETTGYTGRRVADLGPRSRVIVPRGSQARGGLDGVGGEARDIDGRGAGGLLTPEGQATHGA